MRAGAVLWLYEDNGGWRWGCRMVGWGLFHKATAYRTEAGARAAARRFQVKFLTNVFVEWRS